MYCLHVNIIVKPIAFGHHLCFDALATVLSFYTSNPFAIRERLSLVLVWIPLYLVHASHNIPTYSRDIVTHMHHFAACSKCEAYVQDPGCLFGVLCMWNEAIIIISWFYFFLSKEDFDQHKTSWPASYPYPASFLTNDVAPKHVWQNHEPQSEKDCRSSYANRPKNQSKVKEWNPPFIFSIRFSKLWNRIYSSISMEWHRDVVEIHNQNAMLKTTWHCSHQFIQTNMLNTFFSITVKIC